MAALVLAGLVGVLRGVGPRGEAPAEAVAVPAATGAPTASAEAASAEAASVVAAGPIADGLTAEPAGGTPSMGPATPEATTGRATPDPAVTEVWGSSSPAPVEGRVPELPWSVVMSSLEAARGTAFARGDSAPLREVDAPDSPALAADLAALAALRSASLVARGFALQVVSAQEVSREADAVLLRVVDRRPPYDLVDRLGAVRDRRPARGDAAWLVTLVRASALSAWRVQRVEADGSAGAGAAGTAVESASPTAAALR